MASSKTAIAILKLSLEKKIKKLEFLEVKYRVLETYDETSTEDICSLTGDIEITMLHKEISKYAPAIEQSVDHPLYSHLNAFLEDYKFLKKFSILDFSNERILEVTNNAITTAKQEIINIQESIHKLDCPEVTFVPPTSTKPSKREKKRLRSSIHHLKNIN